MDQAAFRPRSAGFIRRNRKLIIWIGLGIIILLAIAYLGIGAVAASQLSLPKRVFDPALNPGVYDLKYEDFHFPARNDGLEIAAWYIPSDQNQKVIILVHGRDNSRTNGFCDQFVPFANELHKAGFSVLMIDLRGHGQSADSRYYFGIKERQDILGAVDWLETRGYQPGQIGVLGYSLGAGSVIGAASEETDIGAIWIDSSYADIKSVIERNWIQQSGLPQIFLYSTEWMVRLLYGYDITASRPVDEIGKIAPRPIFMAHCQKDNTIPISHMDQLLSAAKNTQTWIIPVCDQHAVDKDFVPENLNNHAIGYCVQPQEYGQKVIKFFNEGLK
jgi:alpha/beta superfamily hydrolase